MITRCSEVATGMLDLGGLEDAINVARCKRVSG